MYEGNPKEKSTGNYRIELRQDTATSALEKKFHIQFKTQISRLLKTRFPIAHDDDEIQKLVHRRTCVNSDTTEGGSGTSWKEYLVKWGFSSYRKCCWISADRLDTEFNFSTNRKRFDKRFDKLVNDGKAFEYTKRSTGNSTSSPIEPRDWSLEDGINLEALEPEDIIMSLDPADESTLLLVEENHRESIKERMFLVKWCGLSICESTWETASSLHDDELIKYHNAIRDRFSLEGVKSRKNGISPKTGYMHMFHKERDLLPHQVVGANWIAASCISPSHSAILADDRGLGKIAQTVVALKKLRESTSDPFLIVSSCQTLAQWKDTFKTWSDFVCVMYNGSPEERNIIRGNKKSHYFFLSPHIFNLTDSLFLFFLFTVQSSRCTRLTMQRLNYAMKSYINLMS